MIPGPFGFGLKWPKLKITARSYSAMILIELRAYNTKITITIIRNVLMPSNISCLLVLRKPIDCTARVLQILRSWRQQLLLRVLVNFPENSEAKGLSPQA